MGAIAHVLEAEGLATVCLAQVWGQIHRIRAPRALFAEFPLGRPLGRPRDPAFQHAVLEAAFGLLEAPEPPALETFGEVIDDEADEPLACPLPPRHDPALPAAVDEAMGLRPAYERTLADNAGRTLVGRVISSDEVPDAVAAFVRIADGTPWDEAGLPGRPGHVAVDIRAFYEEAALALADHVAAARATETWFFHHTEAGRTLRRARDAIREQGGPQGGIMPATQ